MSEENVDTNQDQNVADNDVDVNEDNIEDDGVTIDGDDDETTENADESDQDSENADESDQDSDKAKSDKTKEDKTAFAFAKKASQLREEKEKRVQLEQELAAKTQKLEELTKPTRPVIPALPDTYDPQYDQKIAARDEIVRAVERYDLQIANAENSVKEKQASANVARQAQIKTQVDTFNDRSVALDLNQKEFKMAEKAVADTLGYEGAQIAEYLLTHESGPSIVNYLGNNELELDKVAGLSPIDAAVYIATEVMPKIGDLKSSKKISKTPRAAKTLDGRGKVKSKNPYLQGATFE